MSEAGLDPFGFDKPAPFEAAQQGVDGAFGDNKTRAIFQTAQHFEPVEPAWPETGQGCQLDASFAELHFPLAGRIGDHLLMVWHGLAYSQKRPFLEESSIKESSTKDHVHRRSA